MFLVDIIIYNRVLLAFQLKGLFQRYCFIVNSEFYIQTLWSSHAFPDMFVESGDEPDHGMQTICRFTPETFLFPLDLLTIVLFWFLRFLAP